MVGPATSFASVRCGSQSSGPVPLPASFDPLNPQLLRLCPSVSGKKKPPPAGPARNRAPAVPAENPLGRAATKDARRPSLAPLCWRLIRSLARLNPRRSLRWNRLPPGRSPAPHQRHGFRPSGLQPFLRLPRLSHARGQSAPSSPRLNHPRSVGIVLTPGSAVHFAAPHVGAVADWPLCAGTVCRGATPHWRAVRTPLRGSGNLTILKGWPSASSSWRAQKVGKPAEGTYIFVPGDNKI